MHTRFRPLSRQSRAVTLTLRVVLVAALVTVLAGCGGKTPEPRNENDQTPVAALLTPPSAAPLPEPVPVSGEITNSGSPGDGSKSGPQTDPPDGQKSGSTAEAPKDADPDDPPPPPPLLGVMAGDDADSAHKALGRAYRQTLWTSDPPVLRRRYAARNPENPLQQVELETCQTDDRVVAMRVSGANARAVYEAAHHKFAFRFVERSRDEPGMDPGPGPDMPFSRRYAEDVVLRLITTPDGAELRLESEPLRKQCIETGIQARQHMRDYFLEQEKARAIRNRDSL